MGDSLEFEFKFHGSLKLLGRPVTFYPSIAHAFGGNVNGALFLSNFWYWEGKQQDQKEGWIFKSQREIQLETGLSRYQQESARKTLIEYGIMEETRKGMPAKMHFRFNWDKLDEILNKFFRGEKIDREKTFDALLFKLKRVFDKFYLQQSQGTPFDWGRGKSSKEWSGIKHLGIWLEDLIAEKKCKDQGIEEPTAIDRSRVDILPEDIVNSLEYFLENLPKFYRTKRLNPKHLYDNRNEIIVEIRQTINESGKEQSIGSKAADWVGASTEG